MPHCPQSEMAAAPQAGQDSRRYPAMQPQQVPQSWCSYPAQTTDGGDASVLFNSGLVDVGPVEAAPYLHLVGVDMVDQIEGGLATEREANWFYAFEDAVTPVAETMGFFPVGRVRSNGRWELSFYSATDMDIVDVLAAAGPITRERSLRVGGDADPEWKFLFEHIAPHLAVPSEDETVRQLHSEDEEHIVSKAA